MTGEGSFDEVLKNNIRLRALKAALNLEEEMWLCLAWFSGDTGPLVSLLSKINLTIFKERHEPNLRIAINQLAVFMQDNAPCQTAKSVKTFLSEEDVYCYGEACSKSRHKSYWESLEVIKRKSKDYGIIWKNIGENIRRRMKDINSFV